jgi:hypothetical protein
LLLIAPVAALVLHAPSAQAADPKLDKLACSNAYDSAQQLRKASKLLAARDQLALCSKPECPSILRQDCSQWMTEVVGSIPQIVFVAHDATGKDLLDVQVAMDGQHLVDRLDGNAVAVDPGPHVFIFQAAGYPDVRQEVLTAVGHDIRQVVAIFKSPESPEPKPLPPEPAHPGSLAPAIVSLAIGGVALGTALALDLSASSDANNLHNTCAPNCSSSAVNSAQNKYIAAGVLLGVGVIGVGVGVVLWLTRPSSSAPERADVTAWQLDVAPVLGGTMAVVGKRF